MKKTLTIILLFYLSFGALAQEQERKTYTLDELNLFTHNATGHVNITSDARLPEIIKGYVNYLYHKPLRGWRVQLYFGIGRTGREQAEKIKNQFLAEYPDIPVYIYFEQPYFKVKAGNFIDKSSAARLLYLIKPEFPRAYIIEDRIDINNLNE